MSVETYFERLASFQEHGLHLWDLFCVVHETYWYIYNVYLCNYAQYSPNSACACGVLISTLKQFACIPGLPVLAHLPRLA